MQLGTRWDAGAQAPASLDAATLAAIATVEAEVLGAGSAAEADPGAGAETGTTDATRPPRWTLTWLERRPHLELDTGHRIEPHGGTPRIVRPGDTAVGDEDDLF